MTEEAVKDAVPVVAGADVGANPFGVVPAGAGLAPMAALSTQHAASMVEAEQQVKIGMMMARMYPRNTARVYEDAMKSCDRLAFAEKAAYRFPRGNSTIEGPSVNLACELARSWGHIVYACQIVNETDTHCLLRASAWDMETGTRVQSETQFAKKVQRKVSGVTQWVTPDERDFRELKGKHEAILVRNCLLRLMPRDLVDACMERARKTRGSGVNGTAAQREETIRALVSAFAGQGVTVAHIEKMLGHALSNITPDELADLRAIYVSIKDGQAKAHEFFTEDSGGEDAAPAGGVMDRLQEIKRKRGRPRKDAAAPAAQAPAPATAPPAAPQAQPAEPPSAPQPAAPAEPAAQGIGAEARAKMVAEMEAWFTSQPSGPTLDAFMAQARPLLASGGGWEKLSDENLKMLHGLAK